MNIPGNEAPTRTRRCDKDVVLDRDQSGVVYASLPLQVEHYGVEAFDWGYIGPAVAELSLNILTWVLPVGVDGETGIQCEQGLCSAVAWRLHRSFMAECLVRVPYEGGCLRETEIRRWVLDHLAEVNLREEQAPAASRSWLAGIMPR